MTLMHIAAVRGRVYSLERVALSPIRPHVGTDHAALRADQTRPERWDSEAAC
jgi:hypothetical protein